MEAKEFILYEYALDLKKLGYNDPCIGYWVNETPKNPEGQCLILHKKPYNDYKIVNGTTKEYCWAPLYQQAFRWFRKKHNLEHRILRDSYGCRYQITDLTDVNLRNIDPLNQLSNCSYDDAEFYCLKKLIEIVKNKNK